MNTKESLSNFEEGARQAALHWNPSPEIRPADAGASDRKLAAETRWRVNESIERLVSQVKANRYAGEIADERDLYIGPEQWARYLSQAEMARAEALVAALKSLGQRISRIGNKLALRLSVLVSGR